MADQPQTPPPPPPDPGAPAAPSPIPPAVPPPAVRSKPGAFARALPFAPIVLALAIALLARHWQNNVPPNTANALLGTTAHDFSLQDAHKDAGDDPVTLSLLVDKGPVLIVFYRGYNCPRCMGHLGRIADDLAAFTSAGVQVIAISPDTPANTRDSIQAYGDFPFPLLSDRDDKVARAFGLQAPDGMFLHGVFLIDRERRIAFAAKTDEPFTDIPGLIDAAHKLRKAP